MNTKRIGIALVTCFCVILPAAAQKNVKLSPILARVNQYAQVNTPQSIPLTVKTLKIINLPTRPSVHLLFDTPLPRKSSVRLVPPRQVYPLLYKLGQRKMFVPRDIVNSTKALYRGMALKNIDELKNILTIGLEIQKSNFTKRIFAACDPLTAILYAQPTHLYDAKADWPVLIKIPITPALKQYAPVQFATTEAFQKTIPASAISDVWVLLEVNQKADWYKAVLANEEILLFPAHGQLQDIP